jgi:hypothetical protein
MQLQNAFISSKSHPFGGEGLCSSRYLPCQLVLLGRQVFTRNSVTFLLVLPSEFNEQSCANILIAILIAGGSKTPPPKKQQTLGTTLLGLISSNDLFQRSLCTGSSLAARECLLIYSEPSIRLPHVPLYFTAFSVQVTGPGNNHVYSTRYKVEDKFSFRAIKAGSYRFCFTNHAPAPKSIIFQVHVGHTVSAEEIAKTGQYRLESGFVKDGSWERYFLCILCWWTMKGRAPIVVLFPCQDPPLTQPQTDEVCLRLYQKGDPHSQGEAMRAQLVPVLT